MHDGSLSGQFDASPTSAPDDCGDRGNDDLASNSAIGSGAVVDDLKLIASIDLYLSNTKDLNNQTVRFHCMLAATSYKLIYSDQQPSQDSKAAL